MVEKAPENVDTGGFCGEKIGRKYSPKAK